MKFKVVESITLNEIKNNKKVDLNKKLQDEIKQELKKPFEDRKEFEGKGKPRNATEIVKDNNIFHQNSIKNFEDKLIYWLTRNNLYFDDDIKEWNNNDIITYAKNLKGAIPSPKAIDIIDQYLKNDILDLNDPKTKSWIYNTGAYNTSDYKFKSLIFFEDKSELRKYGREEEYPFKEILESEDEKEIKDLISKWATESQNKVDIEDIFKLKKLDKLPKQLNFINELFKSSKKEEKDLILNLNSLLKDPRTLRDFIYLEVPKWEEGKDDLMKPIIIEFIKSNLEEKEEKEVSSINVKLGDILENTKKLKNIKDQINFIKSLFSNINDETKLKSINTVLDNIGKSFKAMEDLRNISISKYDSTNDLSMRQPIINYINKYIENVKSKFSKDKEDISKLTKNEIYDKLWKGIIASNISPRAKTKAEFDAAFEDTYKPGLSYKELRNNILNYYKDRGI